MKRRNLSSKILQPRKHTKNNTMATIKIPIPLRKYTEQKREFKTGETTLSAALHRLVTEYPQVEENLLDEEGNIRSYIRIYVGDEQVDPEQQGSLAIGEDTEVSIVPAIAGGAPLPAGGWEDQEFSPGELSHYSRHFSIPEIGMEGQKKLKAARVLAVGTGGLGAPMLQYLAAAGVGTIGIVDFDVIEASNLHRQVLFGTSDVGRAKVEVARERLREINPHIEIRVHETRLTSENALEIMEDYDLVADGTDNFPTRYLVNDACVMLDKPNVHGSIFQFEGQVSVFNYVDPEGNRGPNYRDLFPEPPPPGMVPGCAEAGVLGVLPGIIGCMQAGEVIKVLTGTGEPLAGKLFLFDALDFSTRTVRIEKNEDNPLTGSNPEITELIDYEAFCGLPSNGEGAGGEREVPEVSVEEFKSWRESGEKVELIDVREPYEREIAEIGGTSIPMDRLHDSAGEIPRDRKVVVHCRSGQRSAKAVRELRDSYGFDNLYNLKGGILAWSERIDAGVPQY